MKTLPESVTKKLYVLVGIDWYNEGEIHIRDYKGDGDDSYAPICETEITVDLPKVDITEQLVTQLEKKAEGIKKKCLAEVGAINQKIKELQALPAPQEI